MRGTGHGFGYLCTLIFGANHVRYFGHAIWRVESLGLQWRWDEMGVTMEFTMFQGALLVVK